MSSLFPRLLRFSNSSRVIPSHLKHGNCAYSVSTPRNSIPQNSTPWSPLSFTRSAVASRLHRSSINGASKCHSVPPGRIFCRSNPYPTPIIVLCARNFFRIPGTCQNNDSSRDRRQIGRRQIPPPLNATYPGGRDLGQSRPIPSDIQGLHESIRILTEKPA